MQHQKPYLKREREQTIKTDFGQTGQRETYGDFLQLDMILNAQNTISDPPQRDELLFIMIHQVSELWLKLMLYEINQARTAIQQDNLGYALKNISRIKTIQEQLISAWKVLQTMTPADYLQFRDQLGASSGFQSFGYRLIEFALGNRDKSHLDVHKHDADVTAMLESELQKRPLYDEILHFIHRQGYEIPEDILNRDISEPLGPNDRLVQFWVTVYQDIDAHWQLYDLAEKLLDVESLFSRWRFEHMSTVERIIGNHKGTGGSSGVSFLKKALDLRFFHDLHLCREQLLAPDI